MDDLELSNWTKCDYQRLIKLIKFDQDFLLLKRSRIVQWTRGIGVEEAIGDYKQQKSTLFECTVFV